MHVFFAFLLIIGGLLSLYLLFRLESKIRNKERQEYFNELKDVLNSVFNGIDKD